MTWMNSIAFFFFFEACPGPLFSQIDSPMDAHDLTQSTQSENGPFVQWIDEPAEDSPPLPQFGAEPTRLDDHVATFAMKGQTVRDGFNSVDADWRHRLNVGWIFPHSIPIVDQEDKVFDLELSSTTVRGVLDALTAADTNYYWLSDGPIVNIVRRAPGEVDMVSGKLEEKIPLLEFSGKYPNGAVSELIKQATSQGVSGLVGIKKDEAVRAWETGLEPLKDLSFGLRLEGKSVRECLNAILMKARPGHWWAYPHLDGVYITLTPHYGTKWKRRTDLMEEWDKVMWRIHELSKKERAGTISKVEIKELATKRKRSDEIERIFNPYLK